MESTLLTLQPNSLTIGTFQQFRPITIDLPSKQGAHVLTPRVRRQALVM